MSHPCEYCESEFKNKRDLNRHQKTAKYCLVIQTEQGVLTEASSYKCECGEIFHRKYHLTRHRKTCSSVTQVNNGTINNTTNTVNVVNINVFGSTLSSLTPELIAEKVREVLSYEAVEEGVAKMTEEVAPTLFTNEKGNSLIRVADASRKKLVYRTDTGDVPDSDGKRTGRLLRHPFGQAALLALEGSDNPDAVNKTIEMLCDQEASGKEALKTLLRDAPAQFENPTQLTTEAHDLADQKTFVQLEKALAKNRKEKKKDEPWRERNGKTNFSIMRRTYTTAISGTRSKSSSSS